MKWLKNLFRKKQKPINYPTQEDVNRMAEEYKRYLEGIRRDAKGRWITPDGDVASEARLPHLIEKKWEDSKGNLLKSCKCGGKGNCECKKI